MLFDDPGSLDPAAVIWWRTLCTQALVRERQELRRVFALLAGLTNAERDRIRGAIGKLRELLTVRHWVECRGRSRTDTLLKAADSESAWGFPKCLIQVTF
jgi:hypothetical protein